MAESITSVSNPRVKALVRLRQGGQRKRRKRFLIEGRREVLRAMECDWPLESLFFCEDLFKSEEAFALVHEAEDKGIDLVRLARDPFLKCAYREGADGLLAVGVEKESGLEQLDLSPQALLVVVESVEKPGNLGAVFRTANAAGADALIITDPVTDPYNPNVIRASQGAFFNLPFCRTDNVELTDFLERKGIQVVATSPDGERLLWQADLRKATALVFGSEDTGLSADWLSNHPAYRLPMKGVTDSLNVGATVAVGLFEAVRQRSV